MDMTTDVLYTAEEYLELERNSTHDKHELWEGKLYFMPGVSENHAALVSAFIFHLMLLLRGQCRIYADIRVNIHGTQNYFYPDVVVIKGERQFADDYIDNLTNPTIVIEVLSQSTESVDRGRKWENYQRIPSLQEYLLVSQDKVKVEQYTRQTDDSWLYTVHQGADATFTLPSVGATLRLAELYEEVEL